MTLSDLARRAKPVFLIVLALYVLSYAAGYLAGRMHWTDVKTLQDSPLLRLSRNLEYKIPGYSSLLKAYKKWHDNCRLAYLFQKNAWGLATLFFINNFFIANLTMIIRSLFVLPILLTVWGRFFQGVVFAQTASSGRILSLFLLEFGGYYLTICGTLNLVFWSVLPQAFRFAKRREALRSGLKIFGLAFLLSGMGMLIAAILEARFILKFTG
jgi:hypothetical protein